MTWWNDDKITLEMVEAGFDAARRFAAMRTIPASSVSAAVVAAYRAMRALEPPSREKLSDEIG